MKVELKTNWSQIINILCNKHESILKKIINEYESKIIYPEKKLIFNCFNYFNKEDLKVVIIGQDPYHNDGEAMGLAFSINKGLKIPSSLKNIFKELENDLNIKRNNPDLSDWASQGILFLNTILTVEKNKPLSHSKLGWENIINDIINYINLYFPNTIFVLMGNNAKKMIPFIENKSRIITSAHPSGLSAYRGFFGSKIFSKINTLLEESNKTKINW